MWWVQNATYFKFESDYEVTLTINWTVYLSTKFLEIKPEVAITSITIDNASWNDANIIYLLTE